MTTSPANPAAAFYASPAARALAATVRAAHRLSTDVGTALAMRLFFTPMARDRRARSERCRATRRARSGQPGHGIAQPWSSGLRPTRAKKAAML